MRLTLRTLLAYLDDILEPKQTKELGEKIADSHFATSLINRIREVLRRRRLTAPTLTGPGSGLDPNTVAEYLDNTLPPEKVADVEKTSLESDIYLAEVAGCHQILTLVLGEPVDIVPESRERIYALTAPEQVATLPTPAPEPAPTKERSKSKSGARPAPQPVAARPAVAEQDDFRKGIPDYLRKPPLWKRALPFVAVGAGLLLVALMIIDPSQSDEKNVTDNAGTGGQANFAAIEKKQPKLPAQEEPTVDEVPVEIASNELAGTEEVEVVEEVVEPPAQAESADEPDDTQLAEIETFDPEASIDPPAPPDGAVEVATTLPGEIDTVLPEVDPQDDNLFPPDVPVETELETETETPLPATPTDTTPTEALDETATETATSETDPGPELVSAESEQDKVAVVETPPQPLETVPTPPEKLRSPVTAQYQPGQNGIMLVHDPHEAGWSKLAPRSKIHPGDRIAVPDPYFASVRLSEGNTHVTLLPGSQNGSLMELSESSEAGHCTLKVTRGRLVFRGNSKSANDHDGPVEIGLKVGNELWQVKFLTPDAVWGLEINPRRPEGSDQPLVDNSYTGDLYVAAGTIQFFDGKQLKIVKDGPAWIPLTPGQRPQVSADGTVEPSAPLTTMPNWLGMPKLTGKQLEHSRRFAREFDEVQPIEISLVGAVDHADEDIAALGVKCFALTENYEVLVKALSGSESESARRAAADGLRDWLPTDPENGDKLKQELSKVYYEETPDVIYSLLWGIPKADAERLAPSLQLVKWMGHDQQVIREMAFDEVRHLSEKQGTLGYHPSSGSVQKRSRAIESWRRFVERTGGLHMQR
ncbi:hypothetical protein CA54_25340 [Symmachiella macrocystis]|uniref:Uncharacterized protein n=1 Tax=Symmachiella macrocystis TaxID=2527985 RepID=A0A5C6BS38_9PLAN|nr:hypothetical protein [Symmachiella macrocystis]TWU13699.1 hypothetical protein CA54_25340 [Symmachiella macrocystis]